MKNLQRLTDKQLAKYYEKAVMTAYSSGHGVYYWQRHGIPSLSAKAKQEAVEAARLATAYRQELDRRERMTK